MSRIDPTAPADRQASSEALTGNAFYDQEVFPRLAKGEKVFNWRAALFGYFWFPYKGLWTSWLKWYLPFALVSSLLLQLRWTVPLLMGSIVLFLLIGFRANEEYFLLVRRRPASTENPWAGLGGWLIYVFCYTLFLGLWGGFFPSARPDRTHTGPSQVQQAAPIEKGPAETPDAQNARVPASVDDGAEASAAPTE